MTSSITLDGEEIGGDVISVSISCGRSVETEAINAGTATIVVDNLAADFNPYFLIDTSVLLLESGDAILLESGDRLLLETIVGSGGAYGQIVQGREVVVTDGSTVVYTGYVEDYDYEWGQNYARATLTCVDALATLGATKFLEWTTTEGELTGERIASVLDRAEVSFPDGVGDRDIDDGTQPLQADLVTYGSNVLTYLQKVSKSEYGRLFVSRLGALTFRDRYAAFGLTSSVSFNDLGTGVDIAAVAVRFGTEFLHFKVSADRENGVAQTATNQAQINANPKLGARHLTLGGMLYQSDDHSAGLASFVLGRSSTPAAVVSGLTIELHQLSESDRDDVCAVDIGDVVDMTWTPSGSTGQVVQTLVVEGRNYRSEDGVRAYVDLMLSDASDPDYFQVDTDAVDGPKPVAP